MTYTTKKFHTRYEFQVSPYKGRTMLTINDQYWDSRERVFYRDGHPEEAVDCSRTPLKNPCFAALRDEIATLEPGWYAMRRLQPSPHRSQNVPRPW